MRLLPCSCLVSISHLYHKHRWSAVCVWMHCDLCASKSWCCAAQAGLQPVRPYFPTNYCCRNTQYTFC